MYSTSAFPLAPLIFRRGAWCVDGGLTDFQPIIDKDTVTVSPLYFSNADIKPSRYVPLWWAIVPPKSPDTIDWLYRLGWEDACRWIKAHPERCDLPHLSTKTLSPISPPPKRPHSYDTPKRVSVHRLLGYNISDQMHRTVARSLDIFLTLLVILVWKPLVLILIYIPSFYSLRQSPSSYRRARSVLAQSHGRATGRSARTPPRPHRTVHHGVVRLQTCPCRTTPIQSTQRPLRMRVVHLVPLPTVQDVDTQSSVHSTAPQTS